MGRLGVLGHRDDGFDVGEWAVTGIGQARLQVGGVKGDGNGEKRGRHGVRERWREETKGREER